MGTGGTESVDVPLPGAAARRVAWFGFVAEALILAGLGTLAVLGIEKVPAWVWTKSFPGASRSAMLPVVLGLPVLLVPLALGLLGWMTDRWLGGPAERVWRAALGEAGPSDGAAPEAVPGTRAWLVLVGGTCALAMVVLNTGIGVVKHCQDDAAMLWATHWGVALVVGAAWLPWISGSASPRLGLVAFAWIVALLWVWYPGTTGILQSWEVAAATRVELTGLLILVGLTQGRRGARPGERTWVPGTRSYGLLAAVSAVGFLLGVYRPVLVRAYLPDNRVRPESTFLVMIPNGEPDDPDEDLEHERRARMLGDLAPWSLAVPRILAASALVHADPQTLVEQLEAYDLRVPAPLRLRADRNLDTWGSSAKDFLRVSRRPPQGWEPQRGNVQLFRLAALRAVRDVPTEFDGVRSRPARAYLRRSRADDPESPGPRILLALGFSGEPRPPDEVLEPPPGTRSEVVVERLIEALAQEPPPGPGPTPSAFPADSAWAPLVASLGELRTAPLSIAALMLIVQGRLEKAPASMLGGLARAAARFPGRPTMAQVLREGSEERWREGHVPPFLERPPSSPADLLARSPSLRGSVPASAGGAALGEADLLEGPLEPILERIEVLKERWSDLRIGRLQGWVPEALGAWGAYQDRKKGKTQ